MGEYTGGLLTSAYIIVEPDAKRVHFEQSDNWMRQNFAFFGS